MRRFRMGSGVSWAEYRAAFRRSARTPLRFFVLRYSFGIVVLQARHCGLRCSSLLTDCTPGTLRATASAF